MQRALNQGPEEMMIKYGRYGRQVRVLEMVIVDEKTVARALITYAAGLMIPGVYLLMAPFYTMFAMAGLTVACGYLAGGFGLLHRRAWARPILITAASAHLTVGLTLLSLIVSAR